MKVFICALALVSYASAGLLQSSGYNYPAPAHSAPVHAPPAPLYSPAPIPHQPAAPAYSAPQQQYLPPQIAAPVYIAPVPTLHYHPSPAPVYYQPAPQSQYLPPSAPVAHHQTSPPATSYGVPAAPAFFASIRATPSAVKIFKIFEQPYQSSDQISGHFSSGPVGVFGSSHQASPDVVHIALGVSPFTPPHSEKPRLAPGPTQFIKVSEAGIPSQSEQIIKLVQEIPHNYGQGNLATVAAPAHIVKVPFSATSHRSALAAPSPVSQLTPPAPSGSYGVAESHSAPGHVAAPQQSYLPPQQSYIPPAPSTSYSAPAPESSYLPPEPQSSYLPPEPQSSYLPPSH